jgi:ribose 5-phosphate isomerase RpiB
MMRCAIGSDDAGPLTDALVKELNRRGAAVERFGALREDAAETEWASIGRAVGAAVAGGRADVGSSAAGPGPGSRSPPTRFAGSAPRCAPMP